MDATQINVSLLAATSAIGLYTSFLPDLRDVRKSTRGDKDAVADVRVGEIAATALTVAIGITASSLIHNPAPAMIALVVAGFLIITYESVLASNVTAL